MTKVAWILLFAAVGMLGLGFGMLLVAVQAKAHSFYDIECCSERDCEPLAPDQVRVTPNGYVLPNGQIVAFGDERVSPDRDYHWCRYPGTQPLIAPTARKICFYAPMGGM